MCFRRRDRNVDRAYGKAMDKAWGMPRSTTSYKYEQYDTMVKIGDIRSSYRWGKISAKEAARKLDDLSKRI